MSTHYTANSFIFQRQVSYVSLTQLIKKWIPLYAVLRNLPFLWLRILHGEKTYASRIWISRGNRSAWTTFVSATRIEKIYLQGNDNIRLSVLSTVFRLIYRIYDISAEIGIKSAILAKFLKISSRQGSYQRSEWKIDNSVTIAD